MTAKPHRKILHVFSTFKVGGPQRRFARIVEKLGGSYSHLLVSMDDRWEAWDILPKDADCKRVDANFSEAGGLETIFRARETLRRLQPDQLVTYNWGAIEWVAANLIPICPHIHIEDGFRPDEIHTRKPRRNVFRRLVIRKRSRLVVVSETMKAIAINEWRIPADRILFVPNGIDVDRFEFSKASPTRQELGLDANDLVIGTIAALRPEKDLKTLIRSFAQVETTLNSRLVIAGDGPERAGLEEFAAGLELPKPVVFTGHTDTPESIYPLFDIFALSSSTEQMPLSVLEAMACQLPVAGYNVGDVALMVANENVPYIVDGSESALTESITQLAQTSELRQRIGKANLLKVRSDYAESSMMTQYEDLFSSAQH